jgi:hypothetical protein
LLRILSLFDASIRTVLPGVGARRISTIRARRRSWASSFTAPLAAIEKAADAVLAKG